MYDQKDTYDQNKITKNNVFVSRWNTEQKSEVPQKVNKQNKDKKKS